MKHVSFAVPEALVASLPPDSEDAAQDMHIAVQSWEDRLNRAFDEAADDAEATSVALDAIDQLDDRAERYDEFVVELRAWGQSPIYAIAWRNLYASLIRQLAAHDDLADRLDRERHARLVEDGIRLRDLDN